MLRGASPGDTTGMEVRHLTVWFQHSDERNTFARVLVEAGLVPDVDGILDFYEKPYKWDDDYALWVRFGRPTSDDEIVWEKFVDEVIGMSQVE